MVRPPGVGHQASGALHHPQDVVQGDPLKGPGPLGEGHAVEGAGGGLGGEVEGQFPPFAEKDVGEEGSGHARAPRSRISCAAMAHPLCLWVPPRRMEAR